MSCPKRWMLAALLASAAGCSSQKTTSSTGERIRFWHTFSALETEGLNDVLDGRDDVELSMISFARGHLVLRDILAASNESDCPDLVRIDASWLPLLAPHLRPAPADQAQTWLPEANELSMVNGARLAFPQSLDGLALIVRRAAIASGSAAKLWPPSSYEQLTELARELAKDYDFGLDLRLDAFWFVPFLHAGGDGLLDPRSGELRIDRESAIESLKRFAGLFGDLAPRPGAAGSDFREEVRRFRQGRVAMVVEGPWALADLGGIDNRELVIGPLPPTASGEPSAVIGGQLFVVPRCAVEPDKAWALARELTAPSVQAAWGRRFGSVPTTEQALAQSGDAPRAFYAALAGAPTLPRHRVTPDLFDDLTPAIAAVIAGDATAAEALEGVARAWARLRRRHDIPIPDAVP